jgi:16S rRNA (uracil1498-N3)-methyltransferase
VFRSAVEPEPTAEVVVVAEPEPTVAVGFALIKGGRPELVVQKLTELGVDRILPLTAERSVVRWDDTKATAQVERFRRVAREAAMQSRRVWLPQIDEVSAPGDVVVPEGLAVAEHGGDPIDGSVRALLVGPEGGWTTDELVDHRTVSLGQTVLRAETAAIVAGTLLTAIRDGRLWPPA